LDWNAVRNLGFLECAFGLWVYFGNILEFEDAEETRVLDVRGALVVFVSVAQQFRITRRTQ